LSRELPSIGLPEELGLPPPSGSGLGVEVVEVVDDVVGLGLGNFPSPVGFVPPSGSVEPFIDG
jgi:hypothetical protein